MVGRVIDALLIGASPDETTRRLAGLLLAHVPSVRLQRAVDIPDAVTRSVQDDFFPDLVVVCQTWPDQFSRCAVERLLGHMPLARIVCCYGDWCDSDGRNRTFWPTAVRVPANAAETRIRRELDVLQGERTPLPFTASRDEAFGFDAVPAGDRFPVDCGCVPVASTVPIQVTSPDRALRHGVQDLVRRCGGRVVESDDALRLERGIRVWDLDPWGHQSARELRRFCANQPETGVVGLMGFPRPEDIPQAKRCGASRVVSKCSAFERLPEAIAAAVRQIR